MTTSPDDHPELAGLGEAATPAFLWAPPHRLVWANAAAAAFWGAPSPSALAAIDWARNPVAAQIEGLGRSLAPGAQRLDRLRLMPVGRTTPLVVQARRVTLADGTRAILVVSTERVAPQRLAAVLAAVAPPPAPAERPAPAVEAGEGDAVAGDAAPAPVPPVEPVASPVPEPAPVPESRDEAPAPAEAEPPETAAAQEHAEPATALAPLAPIRWDEGVAPPGDAVPQAVAIVAAPVPATPAVPPPAAVTETPVPAPEAEAAPVPAAEVSPPAAPSPRAAAVAARRERPLRFVWQTNASGRLDYVSPEFVLAVGAEALPREETFADFAVRQGFDGGALARALGSQAEWQDLVVGWPLAGGPERAEVELSAKPAGVGAFAGYRGFGILRGLAPARTAQGPHRVEPEAAPEPAPVVPESITAAALAPAPPVALPPVEVPAVAAVAAGALPPAATVVAFPNAAPPPAAERRLAPSDEAALRTIARVLGGPIAVPPAAAPAVAEPPAPPAPPVETIDAHALDAGLADTTPPAVEVADGPEIEAAPEPVVPDAAAAAQDDAPAPAGSDGADTDRDTAAETVETDTPAADAAVEAEAPAAEAPATEDEAEDEAEVAAADAPVPAVADAADTPPAPPAPAAPITLPAVTAAAAAALVAAPAMLVRGAAPPVSDRPPVPAPEPAPAPVEAPIPGAFYLPPAAAPPPAPAQITPPPPAGAGASELAALERALEDARRRETELRGIVDTASDGVVVMSGTGRILSLNRSAEALFGLEEAEVAGAPLTRLLAPESHRAASDYLDGLAQNGVATLLNDGREVIGLERNGGRLPLFMTIGRLDTQGPEPRFCAVLRDVTQWKAAEQELTEAKRQAERASHQKSDFLAKVSHEIRTPLNAIIGFSEVMLEERFGRVENERYRGYLGDIRASGEHLLSLVNDLLDLSKIEAGKMELAFSAVRLGDLVQQAVATMQPQANREGVILRSALPRVPPVVADARSIRQILFNLISNAIKFTREGGQVIVSTALSDAGEVVLRVRDTGIGMSDKEITTALEPFRQVATRSRAQAEGTGLGLPLTKALAEANRAAFAIESRPGEGTLVEITFPSTRVLAE